MASKRKAEQPLPEAHTYTVGYCRPPEEYRFRKGQSGNPLGRPPKVKLHDYFQAALAETMEATIDGKVVHLPRRELAARQFKAAVARGDKKAVKWRARYEFVGILSSLAKALQVEGSSMPRISRSQIEALTPEEIDALGDLQEVCEPLGAEAPAVKLWRRKAVLKRLAMERKQKHDNEER